MKKVLSEGEDYYLSDRGFRAFTEKYLLDRGYCCMSGCKHCPYGSNTPVNEIRKKVKPRTMTFQEEISQGTPSQLQPSALYDATINHAPKRKEILTDEEKTLALRNALRYFEPQHHATLIPEFKEELEKYGRIYMYRFRPKYRMYARDINEYPGKSLQAKASQMMIQ